MIKRSLSNPKSWSLLLYLAACCMPVLTFTKGTSNDVWPGIAAAGMGWLGIFVGEFAWLANPLWLLSTILTWTQRLRMFAIALAGMALLLGLTALRLQGKVVPGDEGGVTTSTITGVHSGAYIWLASLVLQLAASLGLLSSKPRANA